MPLSFNKPPLISSSHLVQIAVAVGFLVFVLTLPLFSNLSSRYTQTSPALGLGAATLFDQVPGASVAYSLKKLGNSYSGPAVEVVRTGDGGSTTVGFTGGMLNTSQLENFSNGGDVHVRRWYDQSGNGEHLMQTTLDYMPQIVSAGQVHTDAYGIPTLVFDGNDYLTASDLYLHANPATVFLSARAYDGNTRSSQVWVENGNYSARNGWRIWGEQYSVNKALFSERAGASTLGSTDHFILAGISRAGEIVERWVDNSDHAASSVGPSEIRTPTETLTVGKLAYANTQHVRGEISALIFYPSTISDVYRTIVYSFLTSTQQELPPAAPTDLSAEAGDRRVTLSWNESGNISKIHIYRGTKTGPTTRIREISAGQERYTDSPVSNETVYFYRLKAVNANGTESEFSNEDYSKPTQRVSAVRGPLFAIATQDLATESKHIVRAVKAQKGAALSGVASSIMALPVGKRAVQPWHYVEVVLNHPQDRIKNARGSINTSLGGGAGYPSPWLVHGTAALKADMQNLFGTLKSLGVHIDYVVLDFEQNLGTGGLSDIRVGNTRVNKTTYLQALTSDPRFSEIQAFFDTFGVDYDDVFNTSSDASRYYDAWQFQKIAAALNEAVYEVARGYYPNVQMSNYGYDGTFLKENVLNGNGRHEDVPAIVGTHASESHYGTFGSRLEAALSCGSQYDPFLGFMLEMQTIRAANRSLGAANMPWIAYRKYNISPWLDDLRYYDENVYHLALQSSQPFLYWNSRTNYTFVGGVPADYEQDLYLDALLSALNSRIGASTVTALSYDRLDWCDDMIVTGARIGSNTDLYRITVDDSKGYTYIRETRSGDTLELGDEVGVWYEASAGQNVNFVARKGAVPSSAAPPSTPPTPPPGSGGVGGGGSGGGTPPSAQNPSEGTPNETPPAASNSGGGRGGGGGGGSVPSRSPAVTPSSSPQGLSSPQCTFTRSLTIGSRGTDVTCLQNYLMSTGHYTFSGGATGYFGPVTQSAVASWQRANSIFPPQGYFGPISLTAFQRLQSVHAPSAVSAPAENSSRTETLQRIQELLTLIQELQRQLAIQRGTSVSPSGPSSQIQITSSAPSCTFTRSLTIGSRGTDVTCLQNYLMSTGHYTFSGGATGYFGPVTQSAVASWQRANSIFPPQGYFGPISRSAYVRLK